MWVNMLTDRMYTGPYVCSLCFDICLLVASTAANTAQVTMENAVDTTVDTAVYTAIDTAMGTVVDTAAQVTVDTTAVDIPAHAEYRPFQSCLVSYAEGSAWPLIYIYMLKVARGL